MVTDNVNSVSYGKKRRDVMAVQDLQAKLENLAVEDARVGHELYEQLVIE